MVRMSLRHALLGVLAERPVSGHELAKRIAAAAKRLRPHLRRVILMWTPLSLSPQVAEPSVVSANWVSGRVTQVADADCRYSSRGLSQEWRLGAVHWPCATGSSLAKTRRSGSCRGIIRRDPPNNLGTGR